MEEWLQARTKEQIHEHYKALLNDYESEIAEKCCVISALRSANSRLSALAAELERKVRRLTEDHNQ